MIVVELLTPTKLPAGTVVLAAAALAEELTGHGIAAPVDYQRMVEIAGPLPAIMLAGEPPHAAAPGAVEVEPVDPATPPPAAPGVPDPGDPNLSAAPEGEKPTASEGTTPPRTAEAVAADTLDGAGEGAKESAPGLGAGAPTEQATPVVPPAPPVPPTKPKGTKGKG